VIFLRLRTGTVWGWPKSTGALVFSRAGGWSVGATECGSMANSNSDVLAASELAPLLVIDGRGESSYDASCGVEGEDYGRAGAERTEWRVSFA
jgi:hypothetical protein